VRKILFFFIFNELLLKTLREEDFSMPTIYAVTVFILIPCSINNEKVFHPKVQQSMANDVLLASKLTMQENS
jgi:hypothetical protein